MAAGEPGSVFHDTPLPLSSVPVQAAIPVQQQADYSAMGARTAPAVAVNPDRPLHVGDQVSVEILEDKTGPEPKLVTATGEIEVSPLGRVHVAGKSCAQVEADLKRKLEADYYYTATPRVAIDSVREEAMVYGKVFVAGGVKIPGPVALDPTEHLTVSNIILKVGGFAQFAASSNVRVTRKQRNGESQTFSVDVLGVWRAKPNTQDPQVLDGDSIYVPLKAVNF